MHSICKSGLEKSLSFIGMTVAAVCEARAVCVFNRVHGGESLLKYICEPKDPRDSKCIFLHVYVGVGDGIPRFKRECV